MQERRADMPTIGATTVRHCADAGLKGIALEAGGALVIDIASVREVAATAQLFVYAMPGEARPCQSVSVASAGS